MWLKIHIQKVLASLSFRSFWFMMELIAFVTIILDSLVALSIGSDEIDCGIDHEADRKGSQQEWRSDADL